MTKTSKKHRTSKENPISREIETEVKEVKREWKQYLKFKDENQILFVAFVILVASLVIINTIFILNQNTPVKHFFSGSKITEPDSAKVLTSLQAGSNSAEKVTINNVTENSKTDPAFTIDPNETMLIMNISIINLSARTQQLIPVNQLYVRSSEGDYAALHASMFVTKPLVATELAAGKTATGQISFNVPKHVASPLLYVDTGWDKVVPIVFDTLH